MSPNLPRALRLDASDRFVFARAAEPDEWCVSGAFAFAQADPAQLSGKALAAFRGGFLGVASCGWTTLVTVSRATEADHSAARAALARTLVAFFGAPDAAMAEAAAVEELEAAAAICEGVAVGSVIAVHRGFEAGAIRESFRTLARKETAGPGGSNLGNPFVLVPVEEDEVAPHAPDLVALARKES
jgi:drug/metabolite transporter superfamily protein YnfA